MTRNKILGGGLIVLSLLLFALYGGNIQGSLAGSPEGIDSEIWAKASDLDYAGDGSSSMGLLSAKSVPLGFTQFALAGGATSGSAGSALTYKAWDNMGKALDGYMLEGAKCELVSYCDADRLTSEYDLTVARHSSLSGEYSDTDYIEKAFGCTFSKQGVYRVSARFFCVENSRSSASYDDSKPTRAWYGGWDSMSVEIIGDAVLLCPDGYARNDLGVCVFDSSLDLECVPNSRYCVGDNLYSCNGDGTTRTFLESCDFACSGTSCVEDGIERVEVDGTIVIRTKDVYCGNNICDGNEDSSSCSADCGVTPVFSNCGDGICGWGESESSCSQDCELSLIFGEEDVSDSDQNIIVDKGASIVDLDLDCVDDSTGEAIDGCLITVDDMDGDGLTDSEDKCPKYWVDITIHEDGCPARVGAGATGAVVGSSTGLAGVAIVLMISLVGGTYLIFTDKPKRRGK